jgi:triosephosphate isomerase
MNEMKRSKIVIGNWKMYKTIEESVAFVEELSPLISDQDPMVYLAVPFTSIKPASEAAKDTQIVIGAQNMNDASEGAFTGEVAGQMLVNAGAKFVILGHSERRIFFKETNEFINKKVKRALEEGLRVVLCIGENLTEREEGKTHSVLETQIKECLADVNQLENVILAYEPIWAIGSHQTATPEIAQEAHFFCREFIAQNWNQEQANQLMIQYGGSVKPENAKALLEQPDIDGLLVGGASLSVEVFSKIIHYQSDLNLGNHL